VFYGAKPARTLDFRVHTIKACGCGCAAKQDHRRVKTSGTVVTTLQGQGGPVPRLGREGANRARKRELASAGRPMGVDCVRSQSIGAIALERQRHLNLQDRAIRR
jgi:hypothetical protein